MLKLSEPSFTFLFLIWMANCDNFSLSGKIREISSVVGNVGQLPCPVGSLDDVAMILWFKDSSGAPIYSYDARNEKEEPRHSTVKNDWGTRLYFRVWPNLRRPPALMIKDIQSSDAGIFRCRIDYRNSPTTNSVCRLKVIEPPTRLEILDTSQSRPISDQPVGIKSHRSITYMGPYLEGQNVSLSCRAFGGIPLPEVKWLKNGVEIDSNYDFVGDNYVKNELNIANLGSEHSSDLYTCQASNNDQTKAISHNVNVDVYLGVKYCELKVPEDMTAGDEYKIVCSTRGAYPNVKIEFWKMQKRIGTKFQTRSDADNTTAYNVSYTAEISDDQRSVTCFCSNPFIQQKPLVARKILSIKYTPIVILRFGQNKTSNFTEGESVLMECHVKSNPAFFSIVWRKSNEQLYNSDHVRINGMTLLLTSLTPTSGNQKFFCEATNSVGKGISNPLLIPLHISPKCASSQPARIPLAVGESHQLKCNVLAWPPDLNFYWTLNGSHDIVPILSAAMANYSKGTFEKIIPSDEFDEYIFPASGSSGNMDTAALQNLEMQSEGSGSGEGSGAASESSHVPFGENGSSKRDLPILNKNWTPDGTKPSSHLDFSNSTEEYSQLKSGDKTDLSRLTRQIRSHARVEENIHHEAILSYKVRSIEDYGIVRCWAKAKNSYSEKVIPCLFHIIAKEEANQDEAGNLTIQYSLDVGATEQGESGIRDPSKLQTTLGLMVLLIFIALLVFLSLLLLAKKTRKQIQRIVMTSKGRRDLDVGEVASSTAEKCTPTISYRSKSSFGTMDPFSIVGKDSGILSSCASTNSGCSSSSCSSSSSSGCNTKTTAISTNPSTSPNRNDFPPPPTSIISTASTSHGYGSIGEEEDTEEDYTGERRLPY